MNTPSKYLTVIGLLCATLGTAQDKKIQRADKTFENYAYTDAIDTYKDLVDQGLADEQIYKNLGDANYYNANYDEAADWFGKLFALDSVEIAPDYMYRYAQSLKSKKAYKESDIWMQKYSSAKAVDSRARKLADNADYLENIEKRSGRYEIKNLSVNSPASDFAPSLYENRLVFATARDSGKVSRYIHEWNNQPFLNLYVADTLGEGFGEAKKLSGQLNKRTHESSAVFTKDGKTVYFTRNNSQNGRFARDVDGVSRLKIFKANLGTDGWSNITELPFNGDNFSVANPSLSADETQLYFASDMEGTFGNSDIFVVDINSDGGFGTPKNLGSSVNTEGRETFPFITDGNVLYFASDGHPGLGGLDVFATEIGASEDFNVVNVGRPINTEQDDFAFIIDDKSHTGFFSSNREGGQGSDDIYGFTETEPIDLNCTTKVDGTVIDEETRATIAGAKISLFNAADELLSETTSDGTGAFTVEADCANGEYRTVASKEAYDEGENKFSMVKSEEVPKVTIGLQKKIKKAALGTDLMKFLKLEPIHFDTNKADIRPDVSPIIMKVVKYMKAYPEAKIEVQSHTDVRGRKQYNQQLSQRRADSTVAFLVSEGIDAARLTAKGYGETKLVNNCTTGPSCTNAEHEENRRSEFIVIE